MTFEVDKARGGGFFDEFGVEFFVSRHERNVHHGTAVSLNGRFEQSGRVKVGIKDIGLLAVDLRHVFKAADIVFEPLEHQFAHIYAVARRRVVKRRVFRVYVVSEHRRGEIHRLGDEIFSDNNDRYSGGTEIFLRARENETVF